MNLIGLFQPLGARTGFSLVLLLVEKLLAIALPLLFVRLAQQSQTLPGIDTLPLLVIFTLAGIFSAVIGEFRQFVFLPVIQHAQQTLVSRTLAGLHAKPADFHDEHASATLARVIARAAWSLESFCQIGLFNILPSALHVVLASAILWAHLGWPHAVLLLVVVGVFTAYTLRSVQQQQRLYRARIQADNRLNAVITDSLVNAETVRAYSGSSAELARLKQASTQLQGDWTAQQAQLLGANAIQATLVQCGLLALLGLVLLMPGHSGSGAEGLIIVSMYVAQVFAPLQSVGLLYSSFMHAMTDLRAVDDLLLDRPQPPRTPPLVTGHPGRLVARGLQVRRAGHLVLDNVDLDLPLQGRFAFVGPSGSGKSTLAKALSGLCRLSAGTITVDGQATQDTELRKLTRYVSQTPGLFDESIAYNVAYGSPDVPGSEAMARAVADASLDDMIRERPLGLASPAGEQGGRLSGGERQRIGLARAQLQPQPVMIFDEATSQLDTVTEAAVLSTLAARHAERLVIHISHRLESITDADQIFCLADGRIVESGRHRDLLAAGGVYAQLWDARQQEMENRNGAR